MAAHRALLVAVAALLVAASARGDGGAAGATPGGRANGKRVLALIGSTDVKASHSKFLKGLSDAGLEVDVKLAKDAELNLRDYDEWHYDHLLLLAPTATGAARAPGQFGAAGGPACRARAGDGQGRRRGRRGGGGGVMGAAAHIPRARERRGRRGGAATPRPAPSPTPTPNPLPPLGFGGDVNKLSIVDFVDAGGNVLIALSPDASDTMRGIAAECGVEVRGGARGGVRGAGGGEPGAFRRLEPPQTAPVPKTRLPAPPQVDAKGTQVFDHFSRQAGAGPDLVVTSQWVDSGAILGKDRPAAPVLFRGVAEVVPTGSELVRGGGRVGTRLAARRVEGGPTAVQAARQQRSASPRPPLHALYRAPRPPDPKPTPTSP
jgi:hypothetical protein